jgi:hypothetical protein
LFHKDVLVEKSPFFARCLASGMKEGLEHEIKLPEEDPEDFELLIH